MGMGLATVGLLVGTVGASVVVAGPAQAACASDARKADFWSSWAEAHTEDCSYWSNSYAQHGSRSIWSGWYSAWSRASADSGVSTSHSAKNVFS